MNIFHHYPTHKKNNLFFEIENEKKSHFQCPQEDSDASGKKKFIVRCDLFFMISEIDL